MHNLVIAGKGLFVLASGTALAVANGGVRDGVTAGQLLTGGGGVLLGLAILKGATEVGRLRQFTKTLGDRADSTDRRMDRIEDRLDNRT